MRGLKEIIVGKYRVFDTKYKRNVMLTDNPREAVWESNRLPHRKPVNICGDRRFYKDEEGQWRQEQI